MLAGEVKLPGTFEGRDPYHHAFVQDAYSKADQAQAQFFFTWNVNKLVLFDRSLWDKSLYEKRIQEYDLGLNLQTPDEVDDPTLKQTFSVSLPSFSPIHSNRIRRQTRWGMAPDEYFIRAFNSHISWPVKLDFRILAREIEADKGFDARLQEWMARVQDGSSFAHRKVGASLSIALRNGLLRRRKPPDCLRGSPHQIRQISRVWNCDRA